MPFDHVFIRKNPGFEREQIVRVDGEVMYPGDFTISNANERVSDVIRRAGGLNQFAYPKGANLIRRTIYYKGQTENEIKVETLKEVKFKLSPDKKEVRNKAESILFESLEKKIAVIQNQKKQNEIEKMGSTGNDLFSGDSTSLVSAFNKVRLKEKDLVGINLEAILKNPGGPEDLILQEGDLIQIPKQLQTVRMVGEVLMPTISRFVKNRGVRAFVS